MEFRKGEFDFQTSQQNRFTSKFETLVEHSYIEKSRIDTEIHESQMKLDQLKPPVSLRRTSSDINLIEFSP